MEDTSLVQRLQPLQNLRQIDPDGVFLEIGPLLLMILYFLEQISTVHVLHDNVKAVIFDECLLVGNYVVILHGRQDPDLGQRVTFLHIAEIEELHLFQGVLLGIGESLHSVDGGVCSLS